MGKAKLFKKNNTKLNSNYKDPEKRRKRLVLIFSILMAGLMLFSIFEVALYRNNPDSNNQMNYCDYEFVYRDLGNGAGVLVTDINGQEVEFQNLPTQVTDINIDSQAIALLKDAQVVVLSTDTNQDPVDASMIDYARLQIGLALVKTQNAKLYDDELNKLPVIDCSRSSLQMPVVVFNASNETSVVNSGSCITINAKQRDLMRVKDRIIFEYYDILKGGVVNTECESWFNRMFK